jgi:hypothetical protein
LGTGTDIGPGAGIKLQSVSKVLHTFFLALSFLFLGAQKKHYHQINEEILSFMWVSGKMALYTYYPPS